MSPSRRAIFENCTIEPIIGSIVNEIDQYIPDSHARAALFEDLLGKAGFEIVAIDDRHGVGIIGLLDRPNLDANTNAVKDLVIARAIIARAAAVLGNGAADEILSHLRDPSSEDVA